MKSQHTARTAVRLLTILLIGFDIGSIAAAVSQRGRKPRRGSYVVPVAAPGPSHFAMRVLRTESFDGDVMPCLAPPGADREAYAAFSGPVQSPCPASSDADSTSQRTGEAR